MSQSLPQVSSVLRVFLDRSPFIPTGSFAATFATDLVNRLPDSDGSRKYTNSVQGHSAMITCDKIANEVETWQNVGHAFCVAPFINLPQNVQRIWSETIDQFTVLPYQRMPANFVFPSRLEWVELLKFARDWFNLVKPYVDGLADSEEKQKEIGEFFIIDIAYGDNISWGEIVEFFEHTRVFIETTIQELED